MIYSIADISQMLSSKAEEVCRHLLPTGKRHGQTWECGGVNGETGKSLKVHLEGDHAGKWKDWAEDEFRGDLVDLWEKTKNLTKLETLGAAKSFLGVINPLDSKTTQKRYALPAPKLSLSVIKSLSSCESYLVLERKLLTETLETFGVKSEGKNIVFESWSPQGKLLNRCYVSLQRDSQGRKKVTQEAKCAPSLFGWNALSRAAFDLRSVLICEGQIDAMTWHQWGISALSVPNGSGMTWIEYEWENLEAFETIYLSFDMDGKTDGVLQKVMARLGLHRCRVVSLPYKDANDCLKAGCTREDAIKWINEAKWPRFEGLVEAQDYRQQTIEEFYPDPNKKDKSIKVPMLQRADGGIEFLAGDVTVWTGVTNHGKTTFLNFLMSMLLCSDCAVCIASLEMKPEVLIARIFKAIMQKEKLELEEIDLMFAQIQSKLLFVDKLGSIATKDLFDSMAFAFARYGCTHFLVDSLMRIEGLEEEYSKQGEFMNDLQNFTKTNGCHVHLVCHPRKMDESARPGKMDVKGSSLVVNNADNIISIRRNYEKMEILKERPLTYQEDQNMWDAMISSEKQRNSGWQGAITLRFNYKTFRFSPFTT